MSRIRMCIIAMMFPFLGIGQTSLLNDQYLIDALYINPSFAGHYDALTASIFYRNQWTGFKDAPKNYTFSMHSPINQSRIGLGLLLERSSVGIYNETNILANYAYMLKITEGKLALGVGLGITISNYAWNDLIASDPDDALLMNNPISGVVPAISMGAYYYTKKYFVGISMPFILSHKMDSGAGRLTIKNDPDFYNYFLNGGYNIEFNNKVKLQPSLLLKYNSTEGMQAIFNSMLNLKDKIWIGCGYRTNNMLMMNFQIQLNYQLKMAYSYIYDLGNIAKYTNGSHEITLNYQFRYQVQVMGPRQF